MRSSHRVRDYYDQIGERYETQRSKSAYQRWVSDQELRFVLSRIADGADVLEIGPGSGFFTERLVKKANSVVAIDISDEMLKALRKRIPARNLNVAQIGIERLYDVPNFGHFDYVVCMRVLPHVEDVGSALQLIQKAIRNDGAALFDLWNAKSFPMRIRKLLRRPSPVFTQYFSLAHMINMIGNAGFDITNSWGWGYPRISSFTLDRVGFKLAPQFAYSNLFYVRRR